MRRRRDKRLHAFPHFDVDTYLAIDNGYPQRENLDIEDQFDCFGLYSGKAPSRLNHSESEACDAFTVVGSEFPSSFSANVMTRVQGVDVESCYSPLGFDEHAVIDFNFASGDMVVVGPGFSQTILFKMMLTYFKL